MTASQSVSPSAALNCSKSQVPFTQRGSENFSPATATACGIHTRRQGLACACAHRGALTLPKAAATVEGAASTPKAAVPDFVPPRSSGPGLFFFLSESAGRRKRSSSGAAAQTTTRHGPAAGPTRLRPPLAAGRQVDGAPGCWWASRRAPARQSGGGTDQLDTRTHLRALTRGAESLSPMRHGRHSRGSEGGLHRRQRAPAGRSRRPMLVLVSLPTPPLRSRAHLDGTTLPAVGMVDFMDWDCRREDASVSG